MGVPKCTSCHKAVVINLLGKSKVNLNLCLPAHLYETYFNPKMAGSKNVPSKERVKPWFFVTFNIIISHIFPENLIEIPQVVQKI